jgi:cation:H+ antiporter
VLLAGSHLLVKSAVSIAVSIGVSQMVIGLSIVALGTSLPELVVSVVASIRKEERINLGMVLGSNTFNTLLILGVAALILPIPVEKKDIYINMPIMLLFTIAVFPVLKENIRTYRLMGLFFLLGYFSFIFYSFFSS